MDEFLYKIKCEHEFINIINDLLENQTVQEMKKYMQHCSTSCYDHCLIASYYCYKICKKCNLDYISAARAAMLHDLFLYDWRIKTPDRKGMHAFTHGKCAYINAHKLFNINDIEKDMIINHMWPITIKFPKYIETYVLTFVDKYCALTESFYSFQLSCNRKKLFRYAYIFLSLLIIRF